MMLLMKKPRGVINHLAAGGRQACLCAAAGEGRCGSNRCSTLSDGWIFLQELLDDEKITEIMVNGWNRVYIERGGRIFPWNKSFSSPEKLEDVIQQMAARCNRVINTMQPIVDARLKNGERSMQSLLRWP